MIIALTRACGVSFGYFFRLELEARKSVLSHETSADISAEREKCMEQIFLFGPEMLFDEIRLPLSIFRGNPL